MDEGEGFLIATAPVAARVDFKRILKTTMQTYSIVIFFVVILKIETRMFTLQYRNIYRIKLAPQKK